MTPTPALPNYRARFVWRDYDADTGRFTALDPLGAKGGDDDWYGYCVDDPVNRVDAWGLEWVEAGNPDPAKESGKTIIRKGATSALWQGIRGYATDGLIGAISKAPIGLATGLLMGTVAEYPPVKEKIEQAISWFEDNYKPVNDGTMQD